jgi:hypothetical protein
MHQVYQNSYYNIAADSRVGRGRVFRERERSEVISAKYQGNRSQLFGQKSWGIVPGGLWDAQLLGTDIYKRGWVFQEKIL